MALNRNTGGLTNEFLAKLANEVTEDKCQLEIMLAKAKKERRTIREKARKQGERMCKLTMEMRISERQLHAKNTEIQQLIDKIAMIQDE